MQNKIYTLPNLFVFFKSKKIDISNFLFFPEPSTIDSNSPALQSINPNEEIILFLKEDEATGINLIKNLYSAKAADQVRIVLFYSSSTSVEQIKWIKAFQEINHLISLDFSNLEGEISSLCTLLNPKYSKTQNIFDDLGFIAGLNLYQMTKAQLFSTKDRWKLYDEVGSFVDNLKCFSSFSDIIQTVTSEMVTNALFDGKRHHCSGKEIHSNRKLDFTLDEGEFIEVIYGIAQEIPSQQYMWIIVSDPFGSISRKVIADSMYRAAFDRKPRPGANGGAGLGLFMLYEWCTTMHFFINPEVSTTVACKLRICNRTRDFDSEKKSFHIHVRQKASSVLASPKD